MVICQQLKFYFKKATELSAAVSEGSDLYAKHEAYYKALDAYNKFVEEENQGETTDSIDPSNPTNPDENTDGNNGNTGTGSGTTGGSSTTGTNSNGTTQTVTSTKKNSVDTADNNNIALWAFALTSSVVLASYSVINYRIKHRGN